MSGQEWQFRIEGDDFDIKGMTDLFTSEAKFIKDRSGRTQLVMELPFTASDSQAAQDAAEELLAKVNGIAQTIHGDHENVRIGAAGCKDVAGGSIHQFVQGNGSSRGRSRASAIATVTNATSSPQVAVPLKKVGDQIIATADKDVHLERALYLFGALHLDWRGLYMVLEAAEDANGGEAGLMARKWASDEQIKRFKATANSYKAIRLQARHGSVSRGVSSPTLTLNEAREMVRTIIERWAKSIST